MQYLPIGKEGYPTLVFQVVAHDPSTEPGMIQIFQGLIQTSLSCVRVVIYMDLNGPGKTRKATHIKRRVYILHL
jgi:hypothetical protein